MRACPQIFVEIERARLTQRLAYIKEAEGNVAEAAEILQEVAVVGGAARGARAQAAAWVGLRLAGRLWGRAASAAVPAGWPGLLGAAAPRANVAVGADVAQETFGAMSKQEKIAFILEQARGSCAPPPHSQQRAAAVLPSTMRGLGPGALLRGAPRRTPRAPA